MDIQVGLQESQSDSSEYRKALGDQSLRPVAPVFHLVVIINSLLGIYSVRSTLFSFRPLYF